MPLEALCRPLNKGAVGFQLTKDLHDDGNASVIPGVWTSITGDERVVLRFVSTFFNIH